MAYIDDDGRPNPDPPGTVPPEPPLQALYPNLDRVSRATFARGTLSRQRVDRALIVLAVVGATVIALILATQ